MKIAIQSLFLLIAFNGLSQTPSNFAVDVSQSSVKWYGYYIFSFGEHYGSLELKKGTLTVTNDQITGGSFEIDMTTLRNLDMKEDDGGKSLSDHLKGDDFFSVDKFPLALFEIERIEKIKDAQAHQPNFDVTGKLTLKGISNSLTFPAEIIVQNNELVATAKFKFDRTKWNVQYGSGKFFADVGDGALSDAIGIELKIKATR
jgi:polyisoprenoid-binding protein YceI